MDFRGDERGQPVLIGAILLFAMLILAFATYQGVVVPNQNAEVEYNHFQVVEGQFSELRTSATNAIGSGEQRSVTISLGTRYPPRLIALNPSAPSGSLETTGEGDVEIEGLDYSAADLCATEADNITSRSLLYTPGYHEHRSAESITFENTFRARSFQNGETQFDGQTLVQPAEGGEATKINLMILTGSFSRSSGDSFDLDLNPTHRYGVEVNPDDDFNITVPSRFSATQWENQILADANISSVEQDGDRVKIGFLAREYRISCAALGLNSQPLYQPPGGDNNDPAFDTRWKEDSTITVDPNRGTLVLSMISRDSESGEPISNASVDYAYSSNGGNTGEITFSGSRTGVTNESGENLTSIDLSSAEDGDVYDIYTTAGDDSDVITIEVEEPPFFDVEINSTNSPVEGETLEVDVNVTNSGGKEGTQTVTLAVDTNDDGTFETETDSEELTIQPGDDQSITLTWQTEDGDGPDNYDIQVSSEDDEETDTVRVGQSTGG